MLYKFIQVLHQLTALLDGAVRLAGKERTCNTFVCLITPGSTELYTVQLHGVTTYFLCKVGNHLMSNNFHGNTFWEISLHIFEISVGSATSQVLNKQV